MIHYIIWLIYLIKENPEFFAHWFGPGSAEIIARNYCEDLKIETALSQDNLRFVEEPEINSARLCSWSSNGILATCCENGSIFFWKLWRQSQEKITKNLCSIATCFQWSRDSQKAAVGCEDGRVEVFCTKTKFSSKPIITRGERVDVIEWSSDNQKLLIATSSKISIWDVKSGIKRVLEKSTFPTLDNAPCDVQWCGQNLFSHHTKESVSKRS